MSDSEPRPRPRGRLRWTLGVLLLAGLGVLLCQRYLLAVFVVSGASMEPSLRDGARVLVLKLGGEVARHDLLVFRNPVDPDEVLIKRVLALAEEELAVERGQLYVGDLALGEPYAKPGTRLGELPRTRVPPEHFFVVGDNRSESVDSRRLGAIPARLVIGKVVLALSD